MKENDGSFFYEQEGCPPTDFNILNKKSYLQYKKIKLSYEAMIPYLRTVNSSLYG
jgi:hypothetical protein